MNCGEIINGFEITCVRRINELEGTLYEMEHLKTGAQLAWLKRPDENKLFCIAFKTIPEDSTGVFHILEHSVLCGSKNYNVKEPFVELLKSSMNTFLNAMTYPDKTIYPVASRNDADFMNLMRVYLDAVFNPNIYTNPNIFYQEGWHYELHDEKEEPIYKGVVLNEMKGAYSSVDTVMVAGMNRMLFPDSCYRFESGGDPECITDLTYQQFLDEHTKYYHPSNARIFLDGNVDIDKVLAVINNEYLDGYSRRNVEFNINMQAPVASADKLQYYAIAPDESPEGKTQIAIGKVLSTWKGKEKNAAIKLLCSYLAGSNDAPLKKAILEKKLGQDVQLEFVDMIAQPWILLVIRNTDYSKKEQVLAVIKETIFSLIEGGLDYKELNAAINRMEFQSKDISEPKGTTFCNRVLSSWLYGGDPSLYLTSEETFKSLREKLHTGYFEQLLKEALLDMEHRIVLSTIPSQTLGDEQRQRECRRLSESKISWDKEKMKNVIDTTLSLEDWQKTSDSKEQLEVIPKLNLSEVSDRPEKLETLIQNIEGVTVLQHPSSSKGVVHINAYFSLSGLKLEELSEASLFVSLLGKLPTKDRTVEQLQRDKKANIGSLDFYINSFTEKGKYNSCRPFLVVSCSVLEGKEGYAAELICEILQRTSFDQEEKIHNVLKQFKESLRQMIIMYGNRFAMGRVGSHYSAEAAVAELVGGYACYDYLRDFDEKFEDKKNSFIRYASQLQKDIFNSSNLTLSVTGKADNEYINHMIKSLPVGCMQAAYSDCVAMESPYKEAIVIPAGISYASLGANIYQLGGEYSGALKVMTNILSYEYLWNAVRVQGGAYGAGVRASENGDIAFYSFRDPDPSRSMNIYREAAQFIDSFCKENQSIDKYIIGTVAESDPLLSPKQKGLLTDSYYFRGISYKDRCRMRKEMLETTKEDLLSLCELFERIAAKDTVCVIGNKAALDSCQKEKLHLMSI